MFLTSCTMVLWPLLTYIVFFLYMMMHVLFFTFVSHVLFFFFFFLSFFMHMFLVYNLSLFHTWCLDESCLSVLVKIGCKSTMLWSFFLQRFLRVRCRVRLMYYCKLWESCTSLIIVVCGFVMDCQRGRLLGHILL